VATGGATALAGGADRDPVDDVISAVSAADRLVKRISAWRDGLVVAAFRSGAAMRRAELPASLSDDVAWEWARTDMIAELALALRLPESTVSSRVRRTAVLTRRFPRLAEAHADGEVSRWHVDVMLELFERYPEEVRSAADEALTPRALVLDPSRFRSVARRWRARHAGPVTPEARRAAVADRHVTVTPADDHLAWLSALLPAEQAYAAFHRISDLAAEVQGPDDERSLPQLRADVMSALLIDPDASDAVRLVTAPLRQLSEQNQRHPGRADGRDDPSDGHHVDADLSGVGRSLPEGARGIRATVVLTVPVLTLLGHDDEPALLEGHGPIDIETARRLAADAPSFIRVLTDPHTGAVLSVGRRRYAVPADLRTALAVRDGTCRFPGCARRAARCDVDHSTAWAAGGATAADNLAHLCRKHHRLKHLGRWQVTQRRGGELVWQTPSGRRYHDEPAVRLDTGPQPSTARAPADAAARAPADAAARAPADAAARAPADAAARHSVRPAAPAGQRAAAAYPLVPPF
jgi:hypothetical protein